jgi:hypothetical protein
MIQTLIIIDHYIKKNKINLISTSSEIDRDFFIISLLLNQLGIGIILSSWVCHSVVSCKPTEVSEKYIASIFGVEN